MFIIYGFWEIVNCYLLASCLTTSLRCSLVILGQSMISSGVLEQPMQSPLSESMVQICTQGLGTSLLLFSIWLFNGSLLVRGNVWQHELYAQPAEVFWTVGKTAVDPGSSNFIRIDRFQYHPVL